MTQVNIRRNTANLNPTDTGQVGFGGAATAKS